MMSWMTRRFSVWATRAARITGEIVWSMKCFGVLGPRKQQNLTLHTEVEARPELLSFTHTACVFKPTLPSHRSHPSGAPLGTTGKGTHIRSDLWHRHIDAMASMGIGG